MLLSAEMLVDHATATMDALETALGVPRPRPSWRQLMPEWGFDAYWCRLGSGLGSAPTRLELISPYGTPDPALPHPQMRAILEAQGDRPAKAHSTPITVADAGACAERLTSRGVRFRWDRPTVGFPFDRLWLGFSDDDPITYLPDGDAGLRVELLPTAALALPPAAAEPRSTVDTGAADGHFVRVAARTFTTDDLDAVLGTLERNLDWTPAAVHDGADGRRATYTFGFERSAVLEVLAPAAGTAAHEHRARWGAGPYAIRLTVHGLAAKAADLAARGTPFHRRARDGVELLVVDPADACGTTFELVDV